MPLNCRVYYSFRCSHYKISYLVSCYSVALLCITIFQNSPNPLEELNILSKESLKGRGWCLVHHHGRRISRLIHRKSPVQFCSLRIRLLILLPISFPAALLVAIALRTYISLPSEAREEKTEEAKKTKPKN